MGPVAGENRVPHEVADLLLQVTLGIETEMPRSRLVAPFDMALLVQQHHAIG